MLRGFGKRFGVGAAVLGLCAAAFGFEAAHAAEPQAAAGKTDKLPVPQAVAPEKDYPVSAGGKEDQLPLPPQTTKRKSLAKSHDRLSPSADDAQNLDAPNADRLTPEQP